MEYTKEQKKANKLFEQHRIIDPFEVSKSDGIMPALLNWDDIQSYVKAIGMISPFKKQNLKPASYAIDLLGRCIYWDGKGYVDLNIEEGQPIKIESNSIVFLTLEPLIQLPDYIAARFNLKIDLIYKGCLLGTGPLVDPGFIGRLSFPLHNLTANDYELRGGDELIWMEFTKLTSHVVFSGEKDYNKDEIKNVPYRKFKFNEPYDVWNFMCDAHPRLNISTRRESIRSSIPEAMDEARKSAKEASANVEKVTKWMKVITIASVITIFILIFGISRFFLAVSTSISNSEDRQAEMLKEARVIRQEVNRMKGKVDSLATINRSVTRNDAISPSKKPESTIQSPHQE